MADPVIPAPVVTPAPETPAVAPVMVASPAPPAEAAASSPAPQVDGAAPIEAPAPAAEPAKITTALGDALEKAEKPPEPAEEAVKEPVADGAKPGDEPKATESLSDEPAPLPSYEPFVLPEGLKADEQRLGEFTGILGEFERTTKADHAEVQKFGQKAVDFHVAEVTKAVSNVEKTYQTLWDKQKTDWLDQSRRDPEIGGNRFNTALDSALNFIRAHGGSDEQQVEFRTLMNSSGLGNHPAMIRLLSKAGEAMSEGKPLAAIAPPAAAKSKTQTMYGKRPS